MSEVKQRRFQRKDWQAAAEFIRVEYERRKGKRADMEKKWKEVDRQVAMDAAKPHSSWPEWAPYLELPFQAQSHELLVADCRRLLFPTDRDFFEAHVGLTDDWLGKVDFQAIISGDQNEVPSKIDQEDADALVEGTLEHLHAMYDFQGVFDLLNGEALKYGMWAARIRMVTSAVLENSPAGVGHLMKRYPRIIARPMRNTYPDDLEWATLKEGMQVAGSVVECMWQTIPDLKLAAARGSTDPTRENGGWIPKAVADLEVHDRDRNAIELVEYEGDMVLPRSQGPSIHLPNAIWTIALQKGEPVVIRYREREQNWSSYVFHRYHSDCVTEPTGVGPLLKGAPIQKIATEVFNRLTMTAILNAQPPVKWDPLDHHLQAQGGPKIAPGEQWPGRSDVKPQQIGDIAALRETYLALIQQYQEVTGVTAIRLGQQTKSHQTRFAVDTEITRGESRTVDYVQSMMYGPMPTILHMEYEMLRKTMPKADVYLPDYKGWVEIKGSDLPPIVTFDVFGAAGPLEEREKQQQKNQTLQMLLQLEPFARQAGGTPMDIDAIRRYLLLEVFPSADTFLPRKAAQPAVQPPVVPGIPGITEFAGGTPVTPG